MTTLGIETSCDETSVALVDAGRVVRANLVASQHALHDKYGGVVPELAARAHLERLDTLIAAALETAGLEPATLDAVAVTHTPGLIGALIIGVTAAKSLAFAWGKPLVAVNHVFAHATSAAMVAAEPIWPAVALVVSGGHTSLFLVNDFTDIRPLGRTVDDAAGEAFDKVAAILQLGYPGGPAVDRLAALGDPQRIAFPRARPAEPLDFSFSGLKTAVLYHVHGPGRTTGGLDRLTEHNRRDICASFSAAVVDVLVEKSLLAARQCGVSRIVVGGGVAANTMLRARLAEACRCEGLDLRLTPPEFCTDNAAMIAALGHHRLRAGHFADLSLAATAAA